MHLPACTPRRVLLAVATSFALPWGLGEWAKAGLQPGLSNDPVRQQLLIDYIVIGAIVFLLTMVATALIGCWIRSVLQGPRRQADGYPLPSEDKTPPSS